MNIDFSKLSGKLLELAKIADEKTGNPNGKYLEDEAEISLFLNEAKIAVKNGEITEDDVNVIFGYEKQRKGVKKSQNSDEERKAIIAYLKMSDKERENIGNMVKDETENLLQEMAHQLDTMLIENEVTGLNLMLSRLPIYDLNKLAERYLPLQEKYNNAEFKTEHWYDKPDGLKNPTQKLRNEFENVAQSVLGMPYDEFAKQYEEELKDVAQIPAVIPGVSSWAEMYMQQQAVAKLSLSAQQVFKKISDMNKVLSINFSGWENDIRRNATNKSSDMYIDAMDSLYNLEDNAYWAKELDDFKPLTNWLVNQNFIKAVQVVPVESIPEDDKKSAFTRKIIKDGQIVVEKVLLDGTKEYYDLSGKRILL